MDANSAGRPVGRIASHPFTAFAAGAQFASTAAAAVKGSPDLATTAFNKLGLKPDMVAKTIPVLTSFVGQSGGSEVANLVAGALK